MSRTIGVNKSLLIRLFVVTIAICGVTTILLHHKLASRKEVEDDSKMVKMLIEYNRQRKTGPRKTSHKIKRNDDKKFRTNTMMYSDQYALRDKYDMLLPPDDTKRMTDFVRAKRKRRYEPISSSSMTYDIFDCPTHPPEGYPMQWKILDIIENWNPDDTEPRTKIYQGLCVFDYDTELEKANNYRKAEVPFILRDDPTVLQAAERWAQPGYLRRLLAPIEKQKTEYNEKGNHFMYWKVKGRGAQPEGWKPPTEMIKMSFEDWITKANSPSKNLDVDKPHWYFRLNGSICGGNECKHSNDFLYDELPFFKPLKSFYMIEPREHRGINCRFGMSGVIAENHFDGSRNFIVLLGGERRYILSHPKECLNLCLYPSRHPSGRHSAVDWSNPDLESFPRFKNAMANEVVLQAGDALYLPTFWFHYIINLGVNYQCNARSGSTSEYHRFISECGFGHG